MNNVVLLHSNEPQRSIFPDDSPLYFKVWERPVFFRGARTVTDLDNDPSGYNYYPCPRYKALVRMGETKPIQIGMVSKNYHKFSTKEICQTAEAALIDAMTPQQLAGVRVVDSMAYYGGVCIRDYRFPGMSAFIGGKSESINFRVILSNSYDGTASFKMYCGAIDLFCSNGMIVGEFDEIIVRHSANLELPRIGSHIRGAIDIFFKQADIWKKWVGKKITDEDALEVFQTFPGASERRVAQLFRQFQIEALTHGRTVWALYSAATYFATHNEGEFKTRQTDQDHTAATMLKREQAVKNWIETDQFRELAA